MILWRQAGFGDSGRVWEIISVGISKEDPGYEIKLRGDQVGYVSGGLVQAPGCLEYQAYADRKDPGTLLIFEEWESEEALRAHFATPHMAEFGAALAKAGVSGSCVKKYQVSGEAEVM